MTDTQQAYVPRRSPVLDDNIIRRDWDVWFQNLATNLANLNTKTGVWFDPITYGGQETVNFDNRGAIQRAVNAARDAGGGIVLVRAFDVDGQIDLNMGATGVPIALVGLGRGRSYLRQLTVGADTLVCGATNAEVCDNMVLSDFTLYGNNKAARLIRMNNCLNAAILRVDGRDADYGFYLEGQNESHTFRDTNFINFTANGFICGQVNGGPIVAYDFPEMQKCQFEHVRFGACEDTAMVVTAGFSGVQFSSGVNSFKRVLLEGNRQDGMQISFAFETDVDGISNEDIPRTNGVYYPLVIDSGSIVSVKHAYLSVGQGGNDYAAKVHVNGGWLTLSDSAINGAHASVDGDIVVGGGKLAMTNTFVTDKNAVVFGSAASRNTSLLTNIYDAAGEPITDWPTTPGASYNFLSPSADGLRFPFGIVVNTLVFESIESATVARLTLRQVNGGTIGSINFGGTSVNDVAMQFNGAHGVLFLDGPRTGYADVFAKHFYLSVRPDYTVTNPTTNRSLDVAAAALGDVRQVLGTVIQDLIDAGFYQ